MTAIPASEASQEKKSVQQNEMFCKEAESKKHQTPGMLFFENSLGFQFKSYESMLAVSGVSARPVVAKFLSVPANVRDERGNKNIIRDMQICESFTINSQFDTLKNLRNNLRQF